MLFHEHPKREGAELLKLRSEGNRVTLVVLNYAFGQKRIQLWYDESGRAPDPLHDIILEM